MNVAYAGFDFFSACLESILESGILVSQVYSVPCDNRYNYNNYIHMICQQNKLPLSLAAVDDKAIQHLETSGCNVLITAAYPHKIPDLSATSIKGINIHPSLLPIGRGRWPLPQILLKRMPKSGVTLHKLSNEFDAGDILLQNSFAVSAQETLESLSCKMQIHAKRLVRTLFEDFDYHWQHAQPQPESGEYWPVPSNAERTVDWTTTVADIDRTIRAFGKFESYAHFNNQDWLITDAQVWQEHHDHSPGSVIHMSSTETVVAAADGYVCLRYFYPRPADKHSYNTLARK